MLLKLPKKYRGCAVNFDRAFDRLIGNEGGYSNNPADPGGETMWGITIAVARENGYLGPMVDMPRDTAKVIYRAKYWDAAQCEQLPFSVAFQVLDAAVNHGVTQSIRFLQSACKVPVDGSIGAQTIAAVQTANVPDLILLFNAIRLRFYVALSTFDHFGRGWTKRVAHNLELAAEDLT